MYSNFQSPRTPGVGARTSSQFRMPTYEDDERYLDLVGRSAERMQGINERMGRFATDEQIRLAGGMEPFDMRKGQRDRDNRIAIDTNNNESRERDTMRQGFVTLGQGYNRDYMNAMAQQQNVFGQLAGSFADKWS